MPDYLKLEQEVRDEFPDFKVISKTSSRLMRVIDWALRIITFGKQDQFMTGYITTLGNTVYVPETWWMTKSWMDKAITLRHERVHMRQRARLGAFKYTLMYLFWVLPTLVAVGRRNLEREAYEETIRASVFYFGIDVLSDAELRKRITSKFTGPDYFWMWPFKKSTEAWYDDVVVRIKAERA